MEVCSHKGALGGVFFGLVYQLDVDISHFPVGSHAVMRNGHES